MNINKKKIIFRLQYDLSLELLWLLKKISTYYYFVLISSKNQYRNEFLGFIYFLIY